jgi:hypothetical protein
MQTRGVSSYRLAQFWQAQVMGVKSFTRLQGLDGRLTDKVGRHFITLTKPEWQHIGASQTRVGYFANFRLLKLVDSVARQDGALVVVINPGQKEKIMPMSA